MTTTLVEAPKCASRAFEPFSPLERMLDKPHADFSRDDLLRILKMTDLERITFHYTALDGKYKQLKLPIASMRRAESILADGERVDGSSLFRGVVDVSSSDLYVVPLYSSAFLNP